MSVRGISVCAVVSLFVGVFFSADARAYCRMTVDGGAQIGDAACVERGAPLEWRNPCLSYAVDSGGSQWFSDVSEIEALVDQSFATWQNADCGEGETPNVVFKPLQQSTCQRAEFNTTGNVNTIAFLDPWRDECAEPGTGYDPLAFAVTVVWHNTSTGEILDVDMMVQDRRFTRSSPFSTGNAGGPYADCPDTGCEGNDADLRSILTHEIGHFIGIGHCNPTNPNDPNDPCVQATMFASTDRMSVNKRTLAEDDINAVCDIYPPGNLTSECNAVPMGGLQLNCETTADGDPIECDDPAAVPSGSSGCACSTNDPRSTTWLAFLLGFVALTWAQRRSGRRGARS